MESLELVLLTLDEMIDSGIILEIEPRAICARVTMRSSETASTPLADMTISQALATAKEQVRKSWTSNN